MEGPILFLGRADRLEFRRVIERLRADGPVVIATSGVAAQQALVENDSIGRILVAPSFRNEYSYPQLLGLIQAQPLAELYVLVGPWIEGETRSGAPMPGAHRLYLHQMLPPWRNAASPRRPGIARNQEWRPATLGTDEIWQITATTPWSAATGSVAVCSELAASAECLCEVCVAAGWRTVSHRPSQNICGTGLDAVIYDAVSDRAKWRGHLQGLAMRYQPRTLVALVNFPRPDEVQWMLEAGATEVLGKPYRIDDLLACLAPATISPAISAARGVA